MIFNYCVTCVCLCFFFHCTKIEFLILNYVFVINYWASGLAEVTVYNKVVLVFTYMNKQCIR